MLRENPWRSHLNEVRSQKSEVRSQKSEVRSQEYHRGISCLTGRQGLSDQLKIRVSQDSTKD